MNKSGKRPKPKEVFFDLETTGLDPHKDRIIEMTFIYQKNGSILPMMYSKLVKIQGGVPKDVAEITGINDSMLQRDGESIELVFSGLKTWLKQINPENCSVALLAYNGHGFDVPFLIHELRRSAMDPLGFFTQTHVVWFPDPLVYIRDWVNQKHRKSFVFYRNIKGKISFKLADIHLALLGEPIMDAHRAVSDTKALMAICKVIEGDGWYGPRASKYNLHRNKIINSNTNSAQARPILSKGKPLCAPGIVLSSNGVDEVVERKVLGKRKAR
jgi:DNA polymerase III alpha subunit (gram-positive type)